MNLSKPPAQYDATDQAQMRRAMEAADKANMKRGEAIKSFRMIDTATGAPVTIVVTSGAFVIT